MSPRQETISCHFNSVQRSRQETTRHNNSIQSLMHTHHMGTPNTWAPSHRCLNSVQRRTIWRMSHEAAINDTSNQASTSSSLSLSPSKDGGLSFLSSPCKLSISCLLLWCLTGDTSRLRMEYLDGQKFLVE
jgi:hypothetical protein